MWKYHLGLATIAPCEKSDCSLSPLAENLKSLPLKHYTEISEIDWVNKVLGRTKTNVDARGYSGFLHYLLHVMMVSSKLPKLF